MNDENRDLDAEVNADEATGMLNELQDEVESLQGESDALQEQLGHRDINTTRIYLRLTSEDVMREVGKIQF